MRNHYRWIIGRTHRKRERDIAKWGEGEREETEQEYSVDFYRGQLFLVLTIILNQQKIFWDIATGHICTKLFWDACKYYNCCSGLFLFNGFSGAMTSTRITMRFSITLMNVFCENACYSQKFSMSSYHLHWGWNTFRKERLFKTQKITFMVTWLPLQKELFEKFCQCITRLLTYPGNCTIKLIAAVIYGIS